MDFVNKYTNQPIHPAWNGGRYWPLKLNALSVDHCIYFLSTCTLDIDIFFNYSFLDYCCVRGIMSHVPVCSNHCGSHGDVSWLWLHQMETFPRYWPFVRGIHRSPVNVTRSLDFSLLSVWTNDWVNKWDAGDLRCHRAHYDVTVISVQAAKVCTVTPHQRSTMVVPSV